MEAHIRYARTKDGVNIAYFAIGEGPPLVLHELPFSHLTAEWRCAAVRQRYEAISRTNTLVRFDHRGFGLSEASRDHTLDAFRLDLEAVAEALDLRDITILA